MKLEGIHHITAITGDGPRNVDFYARVLGLRLVKKTVNQDDPTAYHLFFADEAGSAGADLTFFEYPGARRGVAGPGMVYRIVYRVGSPETLEFWADRLGGEGVETSPVDGGLRFADPEGLEYELRHVDTGDAPLSARSREVPEEHALQGFHAVHARVANPVQSTRLLTEVLARPRPRRRRPRHAGHRPLLLQVRLLPRAQRHPLRARHPRPGLHHRRAAGAPRRAPLPAARLRASARPGRGGPHTAARHAAVAPRAGQLARRRPVRSKKLAP